MASKRQCLFWVAFCAFFVAWDVSFAIVDGGWWILFFVPFAVLQAALMVMWINRLREYA